MNDKNFDVVVIGGGPAGYPAAFAPHSSVFRPRASTTGRTRRASASSAAHA